MVRIRRHPIGLDIDAALTRCGAVDEDELPLLIEAFETIEAGALTGDATGLMHPPEEEG